MSKKITFLSIMFVTLFLSSSLIGIGMMSVPQLAQSYSQDDASIAAYPSTDLDNRNTPVSILVYTEFAGILSPAPNNEFRNTMDSIEETYGEQFRYDNLTDYTQLAAELPNYDIFLLVEQELIYNENISMVGDAWASPLAEFVNNGGNIVALDCYRSVTGAGPTFQLLNRTGIVSVTAPVSGQGWTNNLVNATDALARGVAGTWTAPDGSVYFDTTDCEVIVDDGAHAVVAHKIMGKGHIVLLGFDLYDRETNSDILLANAIRLHRHVVFDDSHNSPFEITDEFSGIAEYFATNGFAVSSMSVFSPEYLAACDILVLTLNYEDIVSPDADVIVDFVANGGGLFVASDYGSFGEHTADLLEIFGFIRYNTSAAIQDTDDGLGSDARIPFDGENIHNHSITLMVNRVEMYSCSAYNVTPESGNVLVKTDGDGTATLNDTAVAASATYGEGRVVVFGDTNALTNADSDSDATPNWQDGENEIFFLNTIRWLSAAGIEERTVLFDASHNYNLYVTASYRSFVHFLTENGYTVFWMDDFYETLIDECDIFVVEDGSDEYSTTEINYIDNFVTDGGALLLLGGRDAYGNETDPIGNRFGLDLNNTGYLNDTDDSINADDYIVYNSTNFGNHPIMVGIERVEFHAGTAFTTIGTATSLITTDSDGTSQWSDYGGPANSLPVVAAKEHDKGRVVYQAEYYLPRTNQDGDADGISNLYDADNPLYLLNIFHWLAENRAPTVEVTFPNGGEVLNGTEVVTWDAVDFDNDAMTYDVFLSDDSGGSWSALDTGLTVMEYELNTSLYADASTYMIRVVVHADGLSGEDTSDATFEIDNIDDTGPGLPIDPMLLLIIGAAVLVVVIILVIVMKKKK